MIKPLWIDQTWCKVLAMTVLHRYYSMTAVLFAARHSDDERRKLIYGGSIYVYPPSASAITLIEHARAMIEEVYGPDPGRAQYVLPVEEFSARGAALKPRIIHHPRTKTLIRQVVADAGCDFDDVYIDVPRLRLATSHGYLTSGVGFAFHPHRNTGGRHRYAKSIGGCRSTTSRPTREWLFIPSIFRLQ